MGATLTIRNLDEDVKRKLRLRAASHQTSMEAEARKILAQAVNEPETITPPRTPEAMRERLEAVRGIWKDRANGRSTDEIMRELRGGTDPALILVDTNVVLDITEHDTSHQEIARILVEHLQVFPCYILTNVSNHLGSVSGFASGPSTVSHCLFQALRDCLFSGSVR